MQGIEHWKFLDELSVVEAALLSIDCDPQQYAKVEELEPEEQPDGYQASIRLITRAILAKKLPAKIKNLAQPTHFGYDGEDLIPEYSPDWNLTTVMAEDLKAFYSSIDRTCEFFFGVKPRDIPDYLDKDHPCYSPKLAGAVQAWQAAAANNDLPQARSTKSTLRGWLEEHADEFELTRDGDSLNVSAIIEIAKIANWDRKGGAPKTPELSLAAHQKNLPPPKLPKEKKEPPDPLAGDAVPY